MKTLGIIAAILGVTSLLGWIVVQSLSSHKEDAPYNLHPSNFEKPPVENIIEVEEKKYIDKDTWDITEDCE